MKRNKPWMDDEGPDEEPEEPVVITGAELLRMRRPRRRIRVEKDGVDLAGFIPRTGRHEYFIEWKRLDSPEKLLEWLYHLADKDWFSAALAQELIEEACQHRGVKIHVGA